MSSKQVIELEDSDVQDTSERDDAVVVRSEAESVPAETPDELLERAAEGPAP